MAAAGGELQKRPALEPGRRQQLAIAPQDATGLEHHISQPFDPGSNAFVTLDLDDLVEREGDVDGQGQAVHGRPAEEQVQSLALVVFELPSVRLFLFVAVREPPTPLLPGLKPDVDADVALGLGTASLSREGWIAGQADRTCVDPLGGYQEQYEKRP